MSDDLEGPKPSPRANYPNVQDEDTPDAKGRSITGVYAAIEDQRKKWSSIAIFVGVIAAGLLTIGKIAAAQTDAGIQNTKVRLEQLEQAHKNHIEDEQLAKVYVLKRVDHQDDAIDVINKKVTLLLDAARIPEAKRPAEAPPAPPRPPERDAGR